MELLSKTESEILDVVTPIAKSMIEAWSNDDYETFIEYFEEHKQKSLSLEDFTTQRSWVASELGAYSLNKFENLHKNPSNVVIIWKIGFDKRNELGLGIYRFKEINGEILVSSCICFQ